MLFRQFNKVALVHPVKAIGLTSFSSGALRFEAAPASTVHPRPDERHIRRMHFAPLKASKLIRGRINIEGNPFENLMPILARSSASGDAFVPDAADQKTPDHGFEFNTNPEVRESYACGGRSISPTVAASVLQGSRT